MEHLTELLQQSNRIVYGNLLHYLTNLIIVGSQGNVRENSALFVCSDHFTFFSLGSCQVKERIYLLPNFCVLINKTNCGRAWLKF